MVGGYGRYGTTIRRADDRGSAPSIVTASEQACGLFLALTIVNNSWERGNAHGRGSLSELRWAVRDTSERSPIGGRPIRATSLGHLPHV